MNFYMTAIIKTVFSMLKVSREKDNTSQNFKKFSFRLKIFFDHLLSQFLYMKNSTEIFCFNNIFLQIYMDPTNLTSRKCLNSAVTYTLVYKKNPGTTGEGVSLTPVKLFISP